MRVVGGEGIWSVDLQFMVFARTGIVVGKLNSGMAKMYQAIVTLFSGTSVSGNSCRNWRELCATYTLQNIPNRFPR